MGKGAVLIVLRSRLDRFSLLKLNMVPRVLLCVQTGWIFIGWIQFFTLVGVGTWKCRYFFNYVIIK